MPHRYLSYVSLIIATLFSCKQKEKALPGGVPQAEALATFQLADGFKIELIAAEPLIADPVAMETDEKGNIYIVEMHGYPLDKSGSGKIKLLTDSNGDGFPDQSTVFADKLVLPTGIMRWKKGFLVTDVPDVLYLEDSDGDGKADKREKILTGFSVTNPQHIANTPLYGLDNWIYIAHQGEITPKVFVKEFSDKGSAIVFPNDSNAVRLPRDANGRNVRFNPDTKRLEMLSGESQYGQTFDNYGHHFLTSNADHIFSEIIAARYLQRNPDLLVADATEKIPDHGNAAEVFPVTKNPEHQLLTDVGVITSACGITWYNGGLFPDSFNTISFVAEPVHNLVHADRIRDKGASFIASRVYEKKEFLASTDPWFRPCQFYIGPDGALYVLDYYRQIIEHPEWMSDEVNKSGALYNGSDKGRLYRITPTGTKKMDWCGKLKLAEASSAELVNYLGSNNIWWRRNAQRMLVDRRGEKIISALHQLISDGSSSTATLHALWTLEGLQKTDKLLLQQLLRHHDAEVRENAIRIAEMHLKDFPELVNALAELQNDKNAKVRYQLLSTLGFVNDEKAESIRQALLLKDIDDKWVQIAALAGSAGREQDLLEKIIPIIKSQLSEGKTLFFENCAAVIALSQRANDIKKLVRLAGTKTDASSAWWQTACLKGLKTGMEVKGKTGTDFSAEKALLLSLFNENIAASHRKAALQLLLVLGVEKNDIPDLALKKAQQAVTNKQADVNYRADALQLLAIHHNSIHENSIRKLLDPSEPELLQQAAIKTYNTIDGKQACSFVLQNWKQLTPVVREEAINAFFSSAENINLLLDAMEKKQLQSSAIGWGRMVELMNNDDPNIRNRSRLLLAGGLESPDETYKKYQAALTMQGESKKGAAVFQRVCAICHQVGGVNGKSFGPDLASIRNRDAKFIMADILNPNRSIADEYENWMIEKKNGQKFSGIIASETTAAITLKDASGKETIIARNEIQKLEASALSAMPAGLETVISVKEMADLLAYLKQVH